MFIVTEEADGKPIVVSSAAGDELGYSIKKIVEYCTQKDCNVIFNFNGVDREINKYSYIDGLVNNWYNTSYNSLQDSRDNKLDKILK
jgi:hypothetical protein